MATQLKSTQPVTPSISPRKEMCIRTFNSKELLQFLCVKSWVDGMMTHMLLIVFVFAEWNSTPVLQVFAPREILLPDRRCWYYQVAQPGRYSRRPEKLKKSDPDAKSGSEIPHARHGSEEKSYPLWLRSYQSSGWSNTKDPAKSKGKKTQLSLKNSRTTHHKVKKIINEIALIATNAV